MARRTKQGIYTPINPHKYGGRKRRVNPNNIVFRSNWERVFMKYCDTNPNILNWESEEMFIPYLNEIDGKVHRYFPDFWIRFKTINGISEAIVEIKPLKETMPPTNPKSKYYKNELYTYVQNQSKWKYAEEYCIKNNMSFIVITEEELFNKKKK